MYCQRTNALLFNATYVLPLNSSSENCLSTSAVKVPGKLGSPWEYSRQTGDADRAFASLVRAVEGTSEATVKTVDAKGYYMLAQFPSKVHMYVQYA